MDPMLKHLKQYAENPDLLYLIQRSEDVNELVYRINKIVTDYNDTLFYAQCAEIYENEQNFKDRMDQFLLIAKGLEPVNDKQNKLNRFINKFRRR